MLETHVWKVSNIHRRTKRNDLAEIIQKTINTPFLLFFKDNKTDATLVTEEKEVPPIEIKGRTLIIKRKNVCYKSIESIITPLHNLTYDEQLEKKKEQLMKKFSFVVDPIVLPSPAQIGYRNKCEFTFGADENNIPMLGFRGTRYIDAPNTVFSPSKCIYNISKEMISLVENINAYIKDKPELIYNRVTKQGYLRLLLVRQIKDKWVCVLLVYGPSSAPERTLGSLSSFTNEIRTDTLYISASEKEYEGFSADMNMHLIRGDNIHEENLGGCTFSVSPLSFFQINIGAASKMVSTIREHIKEQVLLDVCCGSGVLGICAVKGTDKKVIGLEIDKKAVENAKKNSAINNVDAFYYSGTVEKDLLMLIPADKKCTALLDPPRCGFSPKLIEKISICPSITQIIYVSCQYSSIGDNLKTISNSGFILKNTVILDMFPYTEQIECIFIYERS